MTTTLTRQGDDGTVQIELAAAHCEAIIEIVLGAEVSHAQRFAVLAALRAARRPTVIWRHPEPGLHCIDHNGRAVRVYSDLAGLRALRAAMATPGKPSAPASDFVEPGARHADVACRAAIKRAAVFLADVCVPLALAAERVQVILDHVVYKHAGALDIVIE